MSIEVSLTGPSGADANAVTAPVTSAVGKGETEATSGNSLESLSALA